MSAALITTALDKGKDLAAFMGLTGVLWSAYSVSGLPVPATIAQVDQRIATVTETIKGVRVDGLEGRRAIISLTKTSLRNEKGAIARTIEGLDVSAKVTMNRRLGEIEDQLKDLEDQDTEVRTKMIDLKPK
jgi:hypothetical protein